ncbi:unnamed protein product [Orchesella dallaii]|uniref:Serine/threonine-protein phosphatase 4 regulatory subunit 1 n=2 Tax=Orchesella dallaii TaxID=48710 RepID=A0ABP1RFK7_9HEXA
MANSCISSGDCCPDKILSLLRSRQKLERDQGLRIVDKLLKMSTEECNSHDPVLVEQCCRALLDVQHLLIDNLRQVVDSEEDMAIHQDNGMDNDDGGCVGLWEAKQGCLSASLTIILRTIDTTSEPIRHFFQNLQELTLRLICDQDVRVRLLAGDIMGALSKQLGPQVFESCRETIQDLITSELRCILSAGDEQITLNRDIAVLNMETDSPASSPVLPDQGELISNSYCPSSDIPVASFDKITVFEASPKGVRSSKLETLLKCLVSIVNAIGPQFKIYVDKTFIETILITLQHPNRFVREAGFSLSSVLLDAGCIDFELFGAAFADKLSNGLSDLCSQTRIAAAIATRKHILAVNVSDREKFFDILLPRLCLCRYFMADTKFLLYSQESWRLIVNNDGPQLVEKYIDNVVNYYLEATLSENHAVREAACACIAELSRKINPVVVGRFIPRLLDALKRSFHDERWHVRDSACLGCGNFIMNFPEECKPEREALMALFSENLGFPISIVRQGAAASIANTIRAYGSEVVPGIMERIVYGLESVRRQLPDACSGLTSLTISPETRYSYPPGPWAQFIPYARPSQPWEFGDGCLYLIGDISPISECQSYLSSLIPKIIKAAQARSFAQHVVLLETMCKIVPPLAKGIGKKPFKEFLALFFEPIFYSIESETPQTAAAGKLCLQQLASMFGPNILKSRIEQFDPRFVQYMEVC